MAPEVAILATAGWLVGPAMTKMFNKACDLLSTGIDERREILEATGLPRLSLAIEKAEKSPNKKQVAGWLKRLKDAYYEAEEAIDLLEYEKLKQKVKDDRKTLKQKAKNERGTPICLPLQFVPPKLKDSLSWKKNKLKGCINKLREIAKEANEFRDLLEAHENASGSDPCRETISEPPIGVFGREIDKENIVILLMKKPSNSEPGPSTRPAIPIIAITGRSGVGKTVLAQYVYKHMDEQNNFNILVWVHTPCKFKATDVIKNMIEIIKKKERASNDYPSTSLEALFTEIKNMLGSKKLLLVLDDFWNDTEDFVEQWEKFIDCLSSCSPGTRILLTTQSKNVAEKAYLPGVTEVLEPYDLQEIEEDQFLKLFMHHAWPSICHLQKEEFEKIGRKIAVKLKGDPGAAKLVGQRLRGKLDPKYWEEVSEKDWLGDKDNMKARIWSYQQLPHDLQRCFAIWSLFPKGNQVLGYILIDIWMAEGFIMPTDNEENLEKIGEEYLQVLVSRYFLEQIAGKEGLYQLHDLLHELAERVQGDDLISIDYSGEIPPQIGPMLCRRENICHMRLPSTMINQLPKKIPSLKNIRTFCVYDDGGFVEMKVIEKILKHMQKLRVLMLPECCDEFPKSIGNLKHLRFLFFFHGSGPLKKLPNSICKLYHLKILELPNCESVPKKFSELISLRRLATDAETWSHISHVGRLASLQCLYAFVVKNKRGYELHQLENLNHLRGLLCITGLENAGSSADAVKANMQNKKHLEEVKFEWHSDERDTDVTGLSTQHVQLLDALQPHPNISALTLKGFGGDRLPNWLLSQNSLKHLTLMNCDKVQEISSIDKSLPNCRSLVLRGLKNLKEMPSLPPNLTYLEVDHLPQLSYLSKDDLLMKGERKQSKLEGVKQIVECWPKFERTFESTLMPVLLFVKERLEVVPESYNSSSQYRNSFSEIVNFDPDNGDYSENQLLDAWVRCMRCYIETMFNKNEESNLILPSSLTHLQISSCSITSDALSTSIQCLVSLSELKLSFIQTITSLPPKEVLCSLKNLKSLTIEHCFLLSSLGGIGAVTSLKVLKLKYCFNLNPSNEPLPSSLETLVLNSCSNVDVTCALDVGSLSHLKHLYIVGWVGRLERLNSLNALYSLGVMKCPGINPSSSRDKYTFELHEVEIDNLLQLKLILSNESISSIKRMAISDIQGDSSDNEVFQSLTSLMQLAFSHLKATHLPKNLKNLASLSYMQLYKCPNLCELEVEELPRNLRGMQIKDCPTLMKKVTRNGPYQVRFFEGGITLTFPIVGGRSNNF